METHITRKPDYQILFTNNKTESDHYSLGHAIGYNPDQELKLMVINMQSRSPMIGKRVTLNRITISSLALAYFIFGWSKTRLSLPRSEIFTQHILKFPEK